MHFSPHNQTHDFHKGHQVIQCYDHSRKQEISFNKDLFSIIEALYFFEA